MTYHYHVAKCPHCDKQHQRGCSLNSCATATVSLEPFTSSDGYVAEWALCLETREVFYIDFGDRKREAENVSAS